MRHLVLILLIAFTLSCRREGGKADEGLEGTPSSATTTAVTGGTVSAMANADKEFVIKAAQGGMAGVTLGQMAADKATHPDVKAFGMRMVTDHSTANDELNQLATLKGLALPSESAKGHKDVAQHLSSLSGKEFDRACIAHMIEDHEKDVAEFQKASQSTEDVDLKAWATKTLPTLQEHLRLAKEIQAKLR